MIATSVPSAEDLCADGAMKIPEACRFLGIGRTSLYKLMGSGELRFATAAGRRVVPRREAARYLASTLSSAVVRQQPAEAGASVGASAPR